MGIVAEGKCKGRAIHTVLGFAGTGSEQIGIMFRIVGGDDDGRSVPYRGYFTEAAMERTVESLRACGWQGQDLSVFNGATEAECAELLPDEVLLTIEHQPPMTPDGKTYAQVQWVNRLGSGVVHMKNKMNDHAARSFAERMRGVVAAIPAHSSGAPRQQPRPAAQQNNAASQRTQQGNGPRRLPAPAPTQYSEGDYGPSPDDDFPFS